METAMREPTRREVDEACMWFRHDFGLLSIAEANKVRHEARGWLRAWQKVEGETHPDKIDIYRAIKESGARSHADIAAAVEKAFSQ